VQLITLGLGHGTPNELTTGLLTMGYGGVLTGVILQLSQNVDARTVDIVFAVKPAQADAENPAKYSISPDLEVVSVNRLTDIWYRMKTSRQTSGQVYAISAVGIAPG